jgi:ankyrin repeat protein
LGANPNYQVDATVNYFTPLMTAINSANLPMVKILVEAGADVNKKREIAGRETPCELAGKLMTLGTPDVVEAGRAIRDYLKQYAAQGCP